MRAMDDSAEIPQWWQPYAGDFPGWQAWRAVSGLLYARRTGTNPPLLVRGEDAEDLRDQVIRAEAQTAQEQSGNE